MLNRKILYMILYFLVTGRRYSGAEQIEFVWVCEIALRCISLETKQFENFVEVQQCIKSNQI